MHFFEFSRKKKKRLTSARGWVMPTTATEKTTLLQMTQDTGSMGGFSGPMCLTCHMTEMRKMAGKKFFAGWRPGFPWSKF